jgi:hypothetical protein
MTNTIQDYINDLEIAKKNVQTLLDEPNASIDMHGIEYWAGRVERLREIIKNSL